MIAAMEWKRFFWKWVSGFAALGLLIPITLLIRPFLLDRPFGAWSVALWPSSLIFSALHVPWSSPMRAAAALYILALITNVLTYSCLGAVLWPVADYLRSRAASRTRLTLSSSYV